MGSTVVGGSGEASIHSSGIAPPPVDDALKLLWVAVAHLGLDVCPTHLVESSVFFFAYLHLWIPMLCLHVKTS